MKPHFTTTRRCARASSAVLALAAVLPLAAFGLAGCGSDSGTSPLTSGLGSGNNGGGDDSAFTGRSYTSTLDLNDGQKGTLDMTVAADGTASGTLKIEDPSRAAVSRLVIATPIVSGTVDPDTGAINLTGGYTLNGRDFPISITGTLPNTSGGAVTGGTLNLNLGGFTYTSNWTVKVSGSTGGPGSGSTGSGNIPTGYVLAASAGIPGVGKQLTITCIERAGDSDPSVVISVPFTSGTLRTGSFPLDPNALGGPAYTNVFYLKDGKSYQGKSGTVVLEQVSSQVKFRLENVVVQELNGGGSITLNGSGQTNVPFVDVDLGGSLPGGINIPGF